MNSLKLFYHGADYKSISIGLTAASAWTWAPALILSSDIAANKGLIGVLSFIIPNILALFLFALIGKRISPFSLFSNSYIRKLYHAGYGAVEFFCVLIQITAGANIISRVFALPYIPAALCFLFVSLLISVRGGLHYSIVSNIFEQILLIILTGILFCSIFYIPSVSIYDIPTGKFSVSDTAVYTLILFSGPIMTNQHWQRADKKGYFYAGLFFGIPLCFLSMIGLFAGITGDYVSVSVFKDNMFLKIILVTAVITGLMSSVQSALTSVIGVFGCDETIKNAYIKMFCLCAAVIFVVIMNIPLLSLWKSMGSFRVIMALGVIYAICRRKNGLQTALQNNAV